jgi:membrane dipeptidase
MLIFDAHLDLAMNALEWNRDLTRPVAEIRRREAGMNDKKDRANNTVALPEMRRGGVGLCVATQIARSFPTESLLPQLPGFASPEIAWAMSQGQLAWYRAMEEAGQMVQIVDRAGLERHVALWQNGPSDDAPIGYILSLEGADSILTPAHLERSYYQGLRAIGPVHYGPGRYGHGTHSSGGLTPLGRELLVEIERLGMILDATHLCDESFWEVIDRYDGPIWASHSNCRTLVPNDRQFSDEQLRALIERGAVIGAPLDAWMMVPGWERGKTTPQQAGVRLAHMVDHMDHICQLAGSAQHCAVGTDLDGGYGKEQTAADLDTIADLARLPDLLAQRGYSRDDIVGIVHGNWLRFLEAAWS